MTASFVLNALLVVVMVTHVFVSPYTKVEESFNIQAMHDILYHKSNISVYDHLEFPGVVPRTFLGPLVISALAYPAQWLIEWCVLPKIYMQVVCRCILGFLVCLSLIKMQQFVNVRTSNLFMLFTLSQFHLMFYSSRTLPNTFALVIALQAIAGWLRDDDMSFIWHSALSIIVFRGELCILLGFLLLVKLTTCQISFSSLIAHCSLVAPLALGATFVVDSFFWQRWVWPEGEVFYYNILLNKSSNWGTLPFLWYFYSAIPRSLLFTSPLLFVAIATNIPTKLKQLLIATLAYIGVYSLLPHKEARFIVYAYPVLNLGAASAACRVYKLLSKTIYLKHAWCLCMMLMVVLNVCATTVFTLASSYNYPGGVAFQQLHLTNRDKANVSVHITNSAAQTGVTRFGELFPTWRYSKDPTFDAASTTEHPYTHLLVETPCRVTDAHATVQEIIHGFTRISLKRDSFPYLHIERGDKLCLIQLFE